LLSRIIQRARRQYENSGAISPLNKTSFGLRFLREGEAVTHPASRGDVLVGRTRGNIARHRGSATGKNRHRECMREQVQEQKRAET
jgi:hypothetical protein